MIVVLPKLTRGRDANVPGDGWVPRGPGWIERPGFKPIIRCNCGRLVGLGAHSIAADGVVTASFLDVAPDETGCGWHVWIRLADYDGPAFGPGEGR